MSYLSITSAQLLHGHTSLETAYKVDNYPYGFRERTTIYYWIETQPKKGDRFCSCTINPKNGKLNKPKCSTYSTYMFLYLDEVGHVKHGEIRPYERETFKPYVDWMINTVGLSNISETQQKAMQQSWYMQVRIGAGYDAVKYSEAAMPAFKDWVIATCKHIVLKPFSEFMEYPEAPTPDMPDETIKFEIKTLS